MRHEGADNCASQGADKCASKGAEGVQPCARAKALMECSSSSVKALKECAGEGAGECASEGADECASEGAEDLCPQAPWSPATEGTEDQPAPGGTKNSASANGGRSI